MENQISNGNSEQNKNLIKRVISEVWNEGNFDVIDELVADDFVIHSRRPEEELKGPKQVREFYENLRSAFPDLKFTITDLVAEGDKVVTHFSASATHKGDFKGIPATGKKITFSGVDIDKITNGKFVECWTNIDELGLLQQLGAVPES